MVVVDANGWCWAVMYGTGKLRIAMGGNVVQWTVVNANGRYWTAVQCGSDGIGW